MRSNPFSKALTRRNLLSGSAALAAATFLPNPAAFAQPSLLKRLGLNAFAGGGGAAQPGPNGASTTTVTPTVASTTLGTINPRFVGLSFEKKELETGYFNYTGTITNQIALFNLLGPGVLRIGGNSADSLMYPADITQADIDALGLFLQETGWSCIYTINLQSSYQNVQSPSNAAAEAEVVLTAKGFSLVGLEIGNEPDNYQDNPPFYVEGENGFPYSTYQQDWTNYTTAILTENNTATFTGPADGNHETYVTPPAGSEDWTEEFANQFANSTNKQIKLLTQHYYRAVDKDDSEAEVAAYLITPDTTLGSDLTDLQEEATNVSFRISECNSIVGGFVNVSDAYASAIWAVNFMFQCAGGHATGVNFHGGGDQTGTYSPIIDNNEGTATGVQPEFYALYLVSQAIQQQYSAQQEQQNVACKLYTVQNFSPSIAAYMYAIQVPAVKLKDGTTTTGAINIVVSNTDASNWLYINATLPANVSSGSVIQMTGDTSQGDTAPLNNKTTYLNGAPIGPDGTWSPTNTYYTITALNKAAQFYVPPLSAVLVQMPLAS